MMQILFFIQDLEKIVYIIKKIKKNYTIKIAQEKKDSQQILEALPKITNELNTLKGECKNLKFSTELNIKEYSGYKIQITIIILCLKINCKVSLTTT